MKKNKTKECSKVLTCILSNEVFSVQSVAKNLNFVYVKDQWFLPLLLLALFPELALNLVSVPVISFITTPNLPHYPLELHALTAAEKASFLHVQRKEFFFKQI